MLVNIYMQNIKKEVLVVLSTFQNKINVYILAPEGHRKMYTEHKKKKNEKK